MQIIWYKCRTINEAKTENYTHTQKMNKGM